MLSKIFIAIVKKSKREIMDKNKFKSEIDTLIKFFEKHCHDKHKNFYLSTYNLNYKKTFYSSSTNLCEECHKLISYSFDRVIQCPHEEKPRCRKCIKPCYEKNKWKSVAKLMRYSGMRLGLINIKKRINSLFD